jgi:uncharacterized protein YbaR (Trm112 family)
MISETTQCDWLVLDCPYCKSPKHLSFTDAGQWRTKDLCGHCGKWFKIKVKPDGTVYRIFLKRKAFGRASC